MLSALAGFKMGSQVNAKCSKLIVVVTLLIVQFNVAIAQSDQIPSVLNNESDMQTQTSNKWGPPYPFTPDEIQNKLMQVLKVPADELSKEKIEGIFDMKMVNSAEVVPHSLNMEPGHPEKNTKWYKVYSQAKVDWYFFVGITVVPNQTFFGFRWLELSKQPIAHSVPMCIDLQKLSEAIEHTNMGWKLVRVAHVQPLGFVNTGLHFTKSENPRDFNSITVEYLKGSLKGSNCMTALMFQINTQKGN